MRSAFAWLHRRAENIAAALLAAMFGAFLLQIVFRYFFNFPVGWSSELSTITWLWLVLWGAAFVLREDEEIRFDLLSAAIGRRPRILFGIVASVTLLVLYGASLPAAYQYVAFMKVEKTTYLKIRFDWLFSIYLLFLVAIIARYLWVLGHLLRGHDVHAPDAGKASSAL